MRKLKAITALLYIWMFVLGSVSLADQNLDAETSDDAYEEASENYINLSALEKSKDRGWSWFEHPVPAGFYDNAEGSPLVPLVNWAKKTIDIEIYEMKNIGLRKALRDALKRGVRIRIVKDATPVGGEKIGNARCSTFEPVAETDNEECKDYKNFISEVKSTNGGKVVAFNKEKLCGIEGLSCFQHGKMVIADGMRVMLSTGNFNTSNLCDLENEPDAGTCNRDFSFISRRRFVVRTLTKIFEKDLAGEPYDVKGQIGWLARRKITVSPHSLDPLIRFVKSAKKNLLIENQYLNEEKFNQAVMEKAKEGVKVKVVLSSACSFGRPSKKASEKLSKIMNGFDESGIQTRFFTKKQKINGKNGYMHAKAIVVDGKKAWVGSVNGSLNSLSGNREYGYFFSANDAVDKLSGIIEQDFVHPDSENWKESLECLKD